MCWKFFAQTPKTAIIIKKEFTPMIKKTFKMNDTEAKKLKERKKSLFANLENKKAINHVGFMAK